MAVPVNPSRKIANEGGADMPRSGIQVVYLCFLVVLVDGYDIAVYGTVLPALLNQNVWALSPGLAGAIASLTLLGQILGAFAAGRLTDRYGRRTLLLASVCVFTVLTFLCAVAPGPVWFGLLRFLMGLAVGGVMPTAIALALEFAPRLRHNFYGSAVQAGYGLGAVTVAVAGIFILPELGFRMMFVIGGLLGLVMLPFLWRLLPESPEFLMARGQSERAFQVAERFGLTVSETPRGSQPARADQRAALRTMMSARYRRATIAFPISGFFGFLLAFGLLTWLPVILGQEGHALGSALFLLVALNVGSSLGSLLLSRIADWLGPRGTIAVCFTVAGICVASVAFPLPTPMLYVLVLAAGFAGFGAQVVSFSFAGDSYPAAVRGTALGWTTGMARIGGIAGPTLGGLLVGSAVAPGWSFVTFGAAALCAGVVILLVPRARRAADLHPDESAKVVPSQNTPV
ncbi:MFS transporter [Rhodococcus sp. JVH1]|uniref:MFS transporter n=1 Tax=Rhodococcus sp. JVH1 TaxID=745408 RepID=UPI001ED94AA0|nr:MFS transporter [Rhodococcus sp. JVH1]